MTRSRANRSRRKQSLVQVRRAKIKAEKRRARDQHTKLKRERPALLRPVFFVPGWTGEEGKAWHTPYPELETGHLPIKEAIGIICSNPGRARYITFTPKQSKSCKSFLDFAKILKRKVRDEINIKNPFDLVGHSMGGLDIVAAITQGQQCFEQVENCLTVASPLKGTEFGELKPRLAKIIPALEDTPHHTIQCQNLDPDRQPIQHINTLESRQRLLDRVGQFYQFVGTRDMAVMKRGRLRSDGLGLHFYNAHVDTVEIDGASHSGAAGITQDPRTILHILNILLGRYQPPKRNYGIISRRSHP